MRIRYQVGLVALGLLLLLGLLRSLFSMALSGRGTTICPQCGSQYIDRSQRRALLDSLFRLAGCLAYRCKMCSHRFYRPRLLAS